jgi:hypothetical protein
MLKKAIILVLVIVAVTFLVYLRSSAKKDISRLPPPETASGEVSAYLPEKEAKGKLDANVRVTGPVWVSPEKKTEK